LTGIGTNDKSLEKRKKEGKKINEIINPYGGEDTRIRRIEEEEALFHLTMNCYCPSLL
jgi:hypothetical protein